jgi:transposase-like protein
MSDDISREAAMWRLTKWADTQRNAGAELRKAVEFAVENGISWSAIARIIDLPRETVWRQYEGGGDIVVIRATRTKSSASD